MASLEKERSCHRCGCKVIIFELCERCIEDQIPPVPTQDQVLYLLSKQKELCSHCKGHLSGKFFIEYRTKARKNRIDNLKLSCSNCVQEGKRLRTYSPMVYRATLTSLVGINDTYKAGRSNFYKTKKASNWYKSALVKLKLSGFTPIRDRAYWASAHIDIFTSRLDIDAPIKSILDVIRDSLSVKTGSKHVGFDDKYFASLKIRKFFESKTDRQRAEIVIIIVPVRDKQEFNQLN